MRKSKVSFADVKAAMQGREVDFLSQYLSSKQLSGQKQPCPTCGGTDKYRHDVKKQRGSFYCGTTSGDVFDHIAHTQSMSISEVFSDAVRFCNLENPTPEQEKEHAARRERIAARIKKLETLNTDRLQLRGLMNTLFSEATNKQEVTEEEKEAARNVIKMIKQTYAK